MPQQEAQSNCDIRMLIAWKIIRCDDQVRQPIAVEVMHDDVEQVPRIEHLGRNREKAGAVVEEQSAGLRKKSRFDQVDMAIAVEIRSFHR